MKLVVAVATAGKEAVYTVTIMSIWYLIQSLRTNKISREYMSFPRTKHSLGDIGYMSVILERIANDTHIYQYLHIWNVSSLPV